MPLIVGPNGQVINVPDQTLGDGLLGAANNLGTLVRGTLQGVGNAAGSAVVAPIDTGLNLLTRAVGGNPNTRAQLTDQSFQLMDQGFNDAGAAARAIGGNLQGGILNLLGAQPAVAAPAPAAQPAVPAVAAPAVSAPAATLTPAAPAPAAGVRAPLTAADLAPTNATLAGLLGQQNSTAARPGVTTTAGVYDATNTPRAASSGNGINFGFGAGGSETASQYLARMNAQDQANAARAQLAQQQRLGELTLNATAAHINDPFTSPQQQKLLLRQYQTQAAQLGALSQGAQQVQLNDIAAPAVLAKGQQANSLAMLQQMLKNAGALQVAGVNAGATTDAAGIRAVGGVNAALATAQGRLAAAQAQGASNAGTQLNQLTEAQRNATIAQLTAAWASPEATAADRATIAQQIALLKPSQVPNAPVQTDPITGAIIVPQAQQNYGLAQILQSDQQLKRLTQR